MEKSSNGMRHLNFKSKQSRSDSKLTLVGVSSLELLEE